jgi:replicative DNA helicase
MAADSNLERPLPNNLDAERSVLGAILLDNNALNPAIENLRAEDFFLDQHRRVFLKMIALGEAQQAIDLITLTEELHRFGELEAAGGAPYLASLADGMPRVSNVEHYARIVKEKAILRNLIHATHNIQMRAFDGEDGADAVLDNAESSIFALAEDRVRAGLIPIKDIVRDNFERLEKIFREGKSITGIPTGYTELDKLTSGFQPSELLILAARPSQGKTALALNLAENIAIRGGHPMAVFSLEMSKESLLQRLVASVAQIDAHKFRTGHLSREDWRRMTEALGTIAGAPVWIDDAGSTSVLEIGAKARRLKRDKGLSLLVVDYLQLITARGKFGNRQEEVSSISRGLKGLAKELQIPVLVLSQLTRAPERDERGPQLSDLRESGAIEQDADVVMFIYRPNFFQSGRDSRRARRNRTAHRQAAQRPDRKRKIPLPQQIHALRGSRSRRLQQPRPRRPLACRIKTSFRTFQRTLCSVPQGAELCSARKTTSVSFSF